MKLTAFSILIFSLIMLRAGTCAATERQTPSCVVLRAGRFFDGRSGKYLEKAGLIVQKGRIVGFASGQTAHVSECSVIDLKDSTILPGLIDSHTHLLTVDQSYAKDFPHELLRTASLSAEQRLREGRLRARSLLVSGFTTVRDLGNSGRFLDVVLKTEIASGKTSGPRMVISGPGLATGSAQFPKNTPSDIVGKEYLVVDKGGIGSAISNHAKAGVDLIKIYADNDPADGIASPKWVQEVVQAAHEKGLKAAVHTMFLESAQAAAKAGADSIEHGGVLDESVFSLLKVKHVFFVPTDFSLRECEILGRHNPDYSDCPKYIAGRAQVLQAAIRAGTPIAFGSDAYVDFSKEGLTPGQAAKEALFSYSDQGLSALGVLKAATSNSGALLGFGDLGVIQKGARADIIAAKGDPLRNVRDLNHVIFVMKNGQIVCSPERPCE